MLRTKQVTPVRKSLCAYFGLMLVPAVLCAGEGGGAGETQLHGWDKYIVQLSDPLFWFGIFAQFLFFMRFVIQWLVSEKKKQSTVPISFWYFSLMGSVSLFIYALKREDLVIMLGQVLACAIYIRNLMLIYGREKRLQLGEVPSGRPDEASDR